MLTIYLICGILGALLMYAGDMLLYGTTANFPPAIEDDFAKIKFLLQQSSSRRIFMGGLRAVVAFDTFAFDSGSHRRFGNFTLVYVRHADGVDFVIAYLEKNPSTHWHLDLGWMDKPRVCHLLHGSFIDTGMSRIARDLRSDMHVLEFGCGTGQLSLPLAPQSFE